MRNIGVYEEYLGVYEEHLGVYEEYLGVLPRSCSVYSRMAIDLTGIYDMASPETPMSMVCSYMEPLGDFRGLNRSLRLRLLPGSLPKLLRVIHGRGHR